MFFLSAVKWLKGNVTLLLILAIAGSLGFLYLQTQSLIQNNSKLTSELNSKTKELEQLSSSFANFQNSIKEQEIALNTVYEDNINTRRQMTQALKIFNEHNLQELSKAKPGLIELRVNNATQRIFDTLEQESQEFNKKLLNE
jgi:septal ring factor EnvC (AmiA/AmiB activator)